jgi:hypothetical protein
MTSSIIVTALLAFGALLGLVVVFMFGRAVFETIVAILRIAGTAVIAAFRFVGNSMLALGWYLVGVFLIVAVGGGTVAYFYWYKGGGFELASYRPPVCTELLDRKGGVLDYLCPFDGVRIWRPIESVSTNLRMIVVMLEDDKFYEHGGLDVDEIWNALEKDVARQKFARGASTITQQLAKNLFLTKEKSILRKASEIPIALRLEREFSKDQILELYLNTIEWGPGVFGVEAASRLYFDHEAATLKDEEAWLLALMIPNPKELNLWVSPKAKKSLLSRAEHLATRLYLEHRLSRLESVLALGQFRLFLEQWAGSRPLALRAGRRFPARWANSDSFSLAEVVSIRRGAAGWLKRFKQAPLRLNLDREIQERLEALQPDAHAHDLSNVIALMEGNQIRALLPVDSRALAEAAQPLAHAQGLKVQVFPARDIPASALLP